MASTHPRVTPQEKKSSGKSRIPIYPYDILGDLEEDSTGI